MKTETGRGRGGAAWAIVKNLIELAKTDVTTVPPEQRARVLERARKEMELWHQSPDNSNSGATTAQQRAAPRLARSGAGRSGQAKPAPRRDAASRRRFPGHAPPRSATATT